MTKKWILGLDSLRIILAVIVLLSHLDIYSVIHTNSDNKLLTILIALVNNSFVGVCAVIAFFVISGIVIHYPYSTGKKLNVPSFLIKRYLRVGVPMVAIYLIAKYLDMPISNLPFWSLYCELIYYTIYPIILHLIKKDKKILNYLFYLTFISSYLVIFYDGNAVQDLINKNKNLNAEYWQFGIFITAILGLPNWILGLKIAAKFSDLSKEISVSTLRIFLMRFFILLLSIICSIARFHFSLSYTLSLNLFGLISAYWIWMEINYWSSHTPNKFMEYLGKISYSVYICHAVAVFLIAQQFNLSLLSISLQIITTFTFSYIFYILIEKPSHILAQKLFK